MLRNMFKIAWRSAIRQKQFALLNIFGLSIGITACLLIALYVQDEMSYDTFHEKGDRIYRVNQPFIWGDWNEQYGSTGPNVAVALKTDVPEFEEVVRVQNRGNHIVTYRAENKTPVSFREEQLYIADENFFNVFSFDLIKGDAETALKAPSSVIITEETAHRYFNEDDPMGKILEVKEGSKPRLFKVTGIVSDLPDKSHLQFDMLTSLNTYQDTKSREWTWLWTTYVTYGLVKEGTDINALEEKIQAIPPKWAQTTVERVFNQTYDEYLTDGRKWNLFLQPISEVYLHSPATGNRLGPWSDIAYVQIFSAVGLLVLVLSAINFMNLSTARSSKRAKEVGVRKVLGSEKKSLVRQFIFESLLFVVVSTVLALVLTEFSLSAFNNIADKKLSLYQHFFNPLFSGSIIVFVLCLGILAGSYPAFYLSSFKPVDVLKGKGSGGFKGKTLRNGLVVFQFAISVALIIGTVFVKRQLDYASNFNPGFDNNNILQVHNMQILDRSASETFQTILRNKSIFSQVGYSDAVPPWVTNEDKYKAYGPDNQPLTLPRILSDQHYIDLLAPKFLAGRNFEKSRGADKRKIILNASAVKALGWGTPEMYAEDSPIGKYITFPTSTKPLFEVIGVVEDFNFNDLKSEIRPLLIANEKNDLLWNRGQHFISARLNSTAIISGSKLKEVIDDVKTELQALAPEMPFQFSFMDKNFENGFRKEQRMGQVLNIFTVMALSIACLGLFGLAAFSAEQRTKELGIRKVLGAQTIHLVISFSSEFTKLILFALLIAVPLAYFAVDYWLTDFAYKTPIQPFVFIAAGISALLVSWLTISFQSLKTAYRNPVDSLRDD
ncbi:MAG: FtsX-like permease family protein [Roseivirga sp.]|nr:FtsX-like permease family protein [Roseivirga sp.]